ncbi:Disintegrin and metalloproteinase domain-containing protein 22 [Triplophysa tibetana]|uniref:Disintegrin and metalloproteinase domain-containing protein 22 n=1 Tax=Triplophysa tibetana TaxID=1572043 RepID=A0A5A9MZH2_9TELE|nr:Disintegrin and metalloproteinase domain-containing protein 22 [Triplophysa tibetana]
MALRFGISFMCLYVAGIHTSISLPQYGDAFLKTRARGDDGRFLGKENTVPVRLVFQKDGDSLTSHDVLNTRVRMSSDSKQNHVALASFQVHAFGKTFVLDVELNHDLLSSNYIERQISEEGKSVVIKGGEHCYYHGKVRDTPKSYVALSTCHGLHGMFFDGNHTYMIEPGGEDTKSAGHMLTDKPITQSTETPDSAVAQLLAANGRIYTKDTH